MQAAREAEDMLACLIRPSHDGGTGFDAKGEHQAVCAIAEGGVLNLLHTTDETGEWRLLIVRTGEVPRDYSLDVTLI